MGLDYLDQKGFRIIKHILYPNLKWFLGYEKPTGMDEPCKEPPKSHGFIGPITWLDNMLRGRFM